MSENKVQFLDLNVSTEDPEASAYQVLQIVRPEWNKEDIEIKVILHKDSVMYTKLLPFECKYNKPQTSPHSIVVWTMVNGLRGHGLNPSRVTGDSP